MTQYIMMDPRINEELFHFLIIDMQEVVIFRNYADMMGYLKKHMQENDTYQEISPVTRSIHSKVFTYQDIKKGTL